MESNKRVALGRLLKNSRELRRVLRSAETVEGIAIDGVQDDIVMEDTPDTEGGADIQFDCDALVLYPYSEEGKTSGNISFYKDAGSDMGIMVRVGDGYFEGIADSEYLDMTGEGAADSESLVTGDSVETVVGILKPYMSSITQFDVQAKPDEYVDAEVTLIEEARTGNAMVLRYVQSKCILLPVKVIQASKNNKGYDLFVLKNNKYISQGGYSLKAGVLAKYGKPKYAVISKSVPAYFKQKGIKSSIDVLINSVLVGFNKDSIAALKLKIRKLEKVIRNNRAFYTSKIVKLESQVRSGAVEVSRERGINNSLKLSVLRSADVSVDKIGKNRSAKALNLNKIRKAFCS